MSSIYSMSRGASPRRPQMGFGRTMSVSSSSPVEGGPAAPAGINPKTKNSFYNAPIKGVSMREQILHQAQPGMSNAYDGTTGRRLTAQEGTDLGPLYHAGWETSGVGPGTRGYRGSYMGGGGYGGGYGGYGKGGYNYGEGTRRPESEISGARNSKEYYAARDQRDGNALDNIWMGNRDNMSRLSERMRAEAGGNPWNQAFNITTNPDGSQSGTCLLYTSPSPRDS